MRTTSSPTNFSAFFHRTAAAVAVSAAVFALSPRPAAAQSTSIPSGAKYACDFENSYCDFNEQSKIGDAPPSARRSSLVSSSRNGSTALRLHTEPGDNSVHGSGAWERNDLQKSPDSSYCNEGQDEWWAVSVLFPSDYSYPAPGQGGVIVDFHHNADSGLPNFSLEVRGESGMRISGYGGASLNGGQYRTQIADPYGAVNNFTRNQWFDYVFHIKWSSHGDGVSEVWLNGKKVHSYSGATLYSGISCYLKLANYHDPTGKASSIVFDRVVRGTSAADVAMSALEGVTGPFAPSTPAAPSTPVTGTTTPSTGTTPTGGSTGGSGTSSSGSATPSATMDSSSYTIAAGQNVSFTARILGNGTAPTGTIGFTSDGASISGCGSVALSGGTATCTTSALSGGQHKIAGVYSGDSAYAGAQAGPITQTVTGSTSGGSGTGSSSQPLPTKFGIDSSSYSINVGASVTFTASIPGSGGTVKFTDNGATIASCSAVPVSSSGSASCATSTLTPGTHAVSGTYSGNGSYSAGVAGPITQTVNPKTATADATPAADAINVQGLWWGGASESGWGVNLAQQGPIVFATWFGYDAQGNGTWLAMSDGRATGANRYEGTLYRTSGPALASTFDATKVTTSAVGSASFSFSDAGHGTFTATIDGVAVTKSITRQVFDNRVPVCTEGGNAASTANYQDLWWRLGGVESGWGLNLTHQGDTMFLTWFTYADDGSPMWLVASKVSKQADGSYGGVLYRTTGPAFSSTWDPSRVSVTPVGSVQLGFSDGANGTFSYTVNGVSGSKPISRQLFSTPATVCTPA